MKCNIITAFVCLLVISLALTLCLSGCSSKNDSSAPSIAKDGTIELTSVDPSAVNNTGDLSFAAKTIAFQREFPVTALMLYVGSRPFVYGFDVINDSCFLMEVDLEGNILRDYDLSFLSPGESIAPINSNISELWVVVSGENESRTATYQKYGTLSEEGIFEEKFNYTSENDVVLNNIYITEDCLFMQRFYSSDNSYTFAVCTLDGQLIDEMKIPYSFIYKVDGKEVYISQENLFIADTSGCTVSYLDMENNAFHRETYLFSSWIGQSTPGLMCFCGSMIRGKMNRADRYVLSALSHTAGARRYVPERREKGRAGNIVL